MSIGEQRSRIAGPLIWSTAGVLAVGIVILLAIPPRAEKPVEPGEKVTAVRTVAVTARPFPDWLRVPGRVEPFQDIVLSVEKPGRIVSAKAKRGDRVRSGDVLLELDDRTWTVWRDRAQVVLREATRNMERWEVLKVAGAVSETEYEEVRQRLDVARIGLREAEVGLSQCVIRSPFDGLIEDRPVSEGEYVPEGRAAFRLLDVSRLKVKTAIPEKDIPFVAVGQHVSLTASSLPGLTVTGDVCFVSMSGRPDSNAFDVEIKVETPDSRLKPGMIVEVSVLRRVWDNSILIPLNAAVPQRGEHLAYVVENRKAVARVLRIEQIYGKEAVIASGLKEGEQLVVEGQRTLQDGMPVEVADVSGGADRGSL